MMARREVMGTLLAGAGMLMAGCAFSGQPTYRFRMTVEIATPQGLKTGSSVMEIVAYKESFVIGDRGGGHSGLGGEAVVVDLADGPVFALLHKESDNARDLHGEVTHALAPEASTHGDFDVFLAAVRRLGKESGIKADLPRADWPMMVRFRNLGDPKSVEKVDPDAIGVKRIRLETTSDPMTTGIEKRLGWLSAAENFQYQGTRYSDLYPLPSLDFRSPAK